MTISQRDGLAADDAAVNGGFEQTVKARRNETHRPRQLDPLEPARLFV